MLKRIMSLGLMVGAVLVFSAPAIASAYEFTNNQEPISGSVEATFQGPLNFYFAPWGSAYGCEFTMTASFEAEKSTIVGFAPVPGTCSGSGVFEGCNVPAAEASGDFNLDGEVHNFRYVDVHEECGIEGFEFLSKGYVEGIYKGVTFSFDGEANISFSMSVSGMVESLSGPVITSGHFDQVDSSIGIS